MATKSREVPIQVILGIGEKQLDIALDRFVDHLDNPVFDVAALENHVALGVDGLAHAVHDVVVIQDVLTD